MAELSHVVACLKLLTAVLRTMHPEVARHEVKMLGRAPAAKGLWWLERLCTSFAMLLMHAHTTCTQSCLYMTCLASALGSAQTSLQKPVMMVARLQGVRCLHGTLACALIAHATFFFVLMLLSCMCRLCFGSHNVLVQLCV